MRTLVVFGLLVTIMSMFVDGLPEKNKAMKAKKVHLEIKKEEKNVMEMKTASERRWTYHCIIVNFHLLIL